MALRGCSCLQAKRSWGGVPESGEFVRWIQSEGLQFERLGIAGTKEFGLLEEYEKLERERCRPFNRVTFLEDHVIKAGLDEQGKKLAVRECRWYEHAKKLHLSALPRIDSVDPLVMERIKGKNIFEYEFSYAEKAEILKNLIAVLKQLHAGKTVLADSFSLKEAYFNKTMRRLKPLRDLIPFANQTYIYVNGKKCRNVFFFQRELERKLACLDCREFAFIHGDCTFSNMMLREDKTPVLIDPRGYFGFTELYGDPLYDWAKLYYSIVGNYDHFNLKEFQLDIGEKGVQLSVKSGHWEDMEDKFFALTEAKPEEVKLLHAVIWLSLTSYAWQDYDSICGAFYNGLYYLEDAL